MEIKLSYPLPNVLEYTTALKVYLVNTLLFPIKPRLVRITVALFAMLVSARPQSIGVRGFVYYIIAHKIKNKTPNIGVLKVYLEIKLPYPYLSELQFQEVLKNLINWICSNQQK